MLTHTELIILPYAGEAGKTILQLLIREFTNDRWTLFQSAVAFAKRSGNYKELLEAMSDFLNKGGRIEMTFGADVFGADVRGSELDAVETLLEEFKGRENAKLFLYHDKKRSRTFHPKIYLFSNVADDSALLILGSSNWSAGGFHDNVEANVVMKLDLKDAEQSECYRNLQTYFSDYWQEP